jgi:hypothetical protein
MLIILSYRIVYCLSSQYFRIIFKTTSKTYFAKDEVHFWSNETGVALLRVTEQEERVALQK